MKKLLLILIYFPLFFGCGNQQSQVSEDAFVEDTPLEETQFFVSDDFELADERTLSLYLRESMSENNLEEFSKDNIKISDSDFQQVMLEWKKTASLYLKKNNPKNGENIIIKYSEIAPSEFWLNKLESEMKQQEAAFSQTIGMDFKVIDSGMNKYKNNYTYMYHTSKLSYEGMSRYSLQCIISVNNKSYQIFINTYDRLSLDDVIINIK